jgi:aspartyl protease family protein
VTDGSAAGRRAVLAAAVAGMALGWPRVHAQPATGSPGEVPSVALAGRFGDRALLVIDGRTRTVAPGQTVDGVRLLSLQADGSADVAVQGRRLILRLGGAPVRVDGAPGADGAEVARGAPRVVLTADAAGHYIGDGAINGRPVRFMVDTGASLVALSQAQADRIGLAFRNAPRGLANTANGEVPANRVRLDSVKLGLLEIPGVEAVVLPSGLPHVLLGNSFLGRLRMTQADGRLTLERAS